MGRRKRKLVRKTPGQFLTPRDEYVYSADAPTLADIAKSWGVKEGGLRAAAAKGRWTAVREQYQNEIANRFRERMVEEASGQIFEANREHVMLGQAISGAATRLLNLSMAKYEREPDKIKIAEGLRLVSQLGKTGVDIERKGLGLVDKIVHVENVTEIVTMVIQTVQKYVADPNVMQNIVADLKSIQQQHIGEAQAEIRGLLEPADDADVVDAEFSENPDEQG